MANWIENHIRLIGHVKAVQLFRRRFDGLGCCGWSFCVHRLAQAFLKPGEFQAWASEIGFVDEEPFDELNCEYVLFAANESLLPMVLAISQGIPDLGFQASSCDLCAGCGYEYHSFELTASNGIARDMRHSYWTEYGRNDSEIVRRSYAPESLFASMREPEGSILLPESPPVKLDPEF